MLGPLALWSRAALISGQSDTQVRLDWLGCRTLMGCSRSKTTVFHAGYEHRRTIGWDAKHKGNAELQGKACKTYTFVDRKAGFAKKAHERKIVKQKAKKNKALGMMPGGKTGMKKSRGSDDDSE